MNLLSIGRSGIIGWMALFSTLVIAQSQSSPTCDPNRSIVCESDFLQSAPPAQKTGSNELRVIFRDGLLRIDAENSLLSVALKTLAARMNAALELPVGLVDELVFAHIGPAPAREVIAQLLNGSRLNYVISFSSSEPTRVAGLRLTSSDPTDENTSAVAQAVVSESTASQLYGAGFTADSGNLSAVEPITDEGPAEAFSSGGDQSANLRQQDGVKLSGEDLDRMQKAQIKQEQYCASRTDGLPLPSCAATKEDLQ
jgi:hypothetical protein